MTSEFSLPNSWAALEWLVPVIILMLVALAVLAFTYWRAQASGGLKGLLVAMKLAALGLLAICLLEPVFEYTRPEPGANLMVVMADDSQSLKIKDRGQSKTRETLLKEKLTDDAGWLRELASDFDVRRYQFDRRLRPVASFQGYEAKERGSDLLGNLQIVNSRFTGRPSAGTILLTDGNVTDGVDLKTIDWESMPPVYPVVIGNQRPARDLGITRVTSTQTNFETSPVTVTAELVAHGYQGQRVTVQLLDEAGDEVEKKEIEKVEDGKPFAVRFRVKPESRGVSVFRVKAFASSEQQINASAESSQEATILNNERTIVVDRGQGPFRVLYVTGRPNWELKFMRRAVQEDPELDLVALVRIAKREAKFSFRGREGQQSNSLFRGFESQDDDTTEQHDEPVFLRLGTRDKDELRGGFPKDEESLFQYHAIVLDDVESGFFSEDQKSLIHRFVSVRGGGLLMLGGQESFGAGKYARNQVGELLPVYLDPVKPGMDEKYRLDLTREGWLEPWVRVESTEDKEKKRLVTMPMFKTLNAAKSIKPGATVLATVENDNDAFPALVVQPFGNGRTAAMMIGDFWRWHLQSEEENFDMMKSWRQMLRWLVADVPQRIDVAVDRRNDTNRTNVIRTRVRDENYKLFDNATVSVEVKTPDGKVIELSAEPSPTEPGTYLASFVSNTPGAYKTTIRGIAEDGTPIQQKEAGWVSDLDREEFQSLESNRKLLEQIAELSGGEVIELNGLNQFVDSLDHRMVPITQTKSLPWWHRWTVFWFAILLLVGEWGIRRWKGLP